MSQRPRVVIVGAGFGGLAAAKALRHLDVDVTVVERTNYHLFQPLLYQVASGLLDPSEIAHPVRSCLRRVSNARVVMAEVRAVDLEARRVDTTAGALGYEHLVVATGSVTAGPGDPPSERQVLGLKHLEDALRLRAHLLACFEEAAHTTDAKARRRLCSVAVVGAGPTGVEYSGAVSELIRHVLPKDFPEIDFADSSVVLIEAGEEALAGFAPRLGRAAARSLRRKGVRLLLGQPVHGVSDCGVRLRGGSVEAATVVWTAGVRSTAASLLPADTLDRRGRVQVTSALCLPGHPEVFAIGDIAAAEERGPAAAMVAPVAIQGGQHVARVIEARLQGRPDPEFRYRDKGTMATIGRGSAVAQIGPVRLSGFVAWVLWLLVHLLYLVGFRSRTIALASWAWNFFFYDRPVRLIIDRPGDGG
jgi:NADH dehydrogenase